MNWVDNIVENGEMSHHEQFLLLLQCFQKVVCRVNPFALSANVKNQSVSKSVCLQGIEICLPPLHWNVSAWWKGLQTSSTFPIWIIFYSIKPFTCSAFFRVFWFKPFPTYKHAYKKSAADAFEKYLAKRIETLTKQK